MALMAETDLANGNVVSRNGLNRQILQIESQVIAWMNDATALHGTVDAADQAVVLAMRDLLIAKLTAAVAI